MVPIMNPYRIAAEAGLECWPSGRTVRLPSRGASPLKFLWDGAAYDTRFSARFLFEAETGPILPPHIEWHLGRLLLMQLCDVPVAGVIWITSGPKVGALSDIIRRWTSVRLTRAQAPRPPPMEIRLPEGTLVWASTVEGA